MITFWFVLILTSLAWYPLTGIYEPADINYHAPLWFSVAAMAISFVLVFLSIRNRGLEKQNSIIPTFHYSSIRTIASTPRRLAILGLASLVFSILIPFPYNFSGILLLAAIIFLFFEETILSGASPRILVPISDSFFTTGMIIAVQTAVLPFFFLFASRFHRADFLAPVMTFLLNIFGAPATFSDGFLNVQIADRVYPFILSFDGLGLYVSLNIVAGAFALFYLYNTPKIYYLILPVVLLVYMIVRYAGVILLFLELEQVNVLWRLDVLTVSLLPLPFVLAKMVHYSPLQTVARELNSRAAEGLERGTEGRESRRFTAAMVLFVLSSVTFFGFVDPGQKKAGRILLDEGHSNWEWTTQKFDTTWYDQQSTYNYYCMAEYLKYFYKVDQKTQPLTKNLLANYDILFIKTPTKPFSQHELSAIKGFVKRGGGLLLVGDHTNVFGITTNLNPIAEQFGMSFTYDAQYDLNGDLSDYTRPKILPDPVVQHMPPFMFETSCMIDAPLMAESSITGYGIKSVGADYSQANFFPASAGDATDTEFGLFVQAAGVIYGKGRVFLLSDSTPWSNFSMFMPGKPELLLGIMEWLDRTNTILDWIHPISAVLGILSLIALIILASKLERSKTIFVVIATGFLFVPLSVVAFHGLNLLDYPVPKPHSEYTKVDFETEHSDIELPTLHLAMDAERAYDTFFIWLQRLNYVPSVKPTYLEALRDADAVVVTNPVKPFSKKEIHATKIFLEKGGALYIMDDPRRNHFVIANELLSPFHVRLVANDTLGLPILLATDTADANSISSFEAGRVSGGVPILYARMKNIPQTPYGFASPAPSQRNFRMPPGGPFGNAYPQNLWTNREPMMQGTGPPLPSGVVERLGEGRIVALATSFLFSDREMGFTSVIPDTNMRRIYSLEYSLFRQYVDSVKEK